MTKTFTFTYTKDAEYSIGDTVLIIDSPDRNVLKLTVSELLKLETEKAVIESYCIGKYGAVDYCTVKTLLDDRLVQIKADHLISKHHSPLLKIIKAHFEGMVDSLVGGIIDRNEDLINKGIEAGKRFFECDA